MANFHELGCFTSYYEPLNERRWFEVEESDAPVDPTHIGVTSYRLNYENCGDLSDCFLDTWCSNHLYMSEGSVDWNLQTYLDALISRAARIPVLQFNRVDFRLPWLRQYYPNAKILHLIRDPRDQWMSILYGERVSRDVTLGSFTSFDKFYLLNWLRDLQTVFPCLALPGAETPYKGHYLLWRLSQIFVKVSLITRLSTKTLRPHRYHFSNNAWRRSKRLQSPKTPGPR